MPRYKNVFIAPMIGIGLIIGYLFGAASAEASNLNYAHA
jgi:hypothetical protein